MKIKLLQLNTQKAPELAFKSYCRALDLGGVRPENYDTVWEGEIECEDLEAIYRTFNLCPPEGYHGRSMSVSDVVAVDEAGAWREFYCDNIGFVEIPEDDGRAWLPVLLGSESKEEAAGDGE